MRYKKTQEGMFIALFALATVVIITILVSYMSNWVNDMVATQTQVFFGKQAYWNAHSGMEIATSKRIASLDGIPSADVSFTTGTISIDPIAIFDEPNTYLGGNKVTSIKSTGSDLRGRSRAMKLTVDQPSTGNFARYFDGTGDYITISDHNELDIGTSDFTLSIWLYLHEDTDDDSDGFVDDDVEMEVINKKNGTGNPGYGMRIKNSAVWVEHMKSGGAHTGSNSSGPTSIKVNQWTHVAAVFDQNTNNRVTIYVNGVSENPISITQGDVTNAVDLGIGRRLATSDNDFHGLVDAPVIWDTQLVEGEIQTIFTQGPAFNISSIQSGSIKGNWKFDDSGNTLTDEEENSNGANTSTIQTGI